MGPYAGAQAGGLSKRSTQWEDGGAIGGALQCTG